MKKITIEVKENGKLSIEADGFSDDSCLDHLKEIEKIFGEAEDVKLKREAKNKHRISRTNKA